MASAGDVIDGKYEILKLIGSGGMSKVYLAMDKRLNKQWAVKEITKRTRDMNNEVVIQSAIAEANMIKKLDHPALPRIVDIIENGDMIFVIMDYIEGETLGNVLKAEGPQPQELVVEWALQLCEVLDYLHTRNPSIIYRDMKPDNIMLKPDGNIKLIDFGIAREYKEHKSSDTIGLGTRGYAAPEQFGGQAQTDPRTDIYCLGMTLHHLLTGKNPGEPPYETYPIRHWNPQLSTGLEVIVQKCINLDPDKRYQSCAELAYALYHYDELSAGYIAKQKKKWHLFLFSVLSMLFFLGTGFAGMGMKNHEQNSTYGHYREEAKKAQEAEEKLALYSQAIDVKPEDTQAYLEMINVCKEDLNFTPEEETILKNKIEVNQDALKKQENYAELAYNIGELYWFYYSYGASDNPEGDSVKIQGRIDAVPWFEDALSYGAEGDTFYNKAGIYHNIGTFDKEYNIKVAEGNEKGLLKKYWNNMEKLVEMVKDSNESEIVVLEVYRLVTNALDSRARKLRQDGVSREAMEKMHDLIKEEVININTIDEKPGKLKEEIKKHYVDGDADPISREIANAFAD